MINAATAIVGHIEDDLHAHPALWFAEHREKGRLLLLLRIRRRKRGIGNRGLITGGGERVGNVAISCPIEATANTDNVGGGVLRARRDDPVAITGGGGARRT